jgi:hypothetical protein
MFDVTNKQSLINLLSDKDNSRKIKRSWRKELMFKAIDSKHPMMVLGISIESLTQAKNNHALPALC